MKYIFSAASLSPLLFPILLTPFPSTISAKSTGDYGGDNSHSMVRVSMSGHDTIRIAVSSQPGRLASVNLPGIDISNALIQSERHATCFFWRAADSDDDVDSVTDSAAPTTEKEKGNTFVSYAFTSRRTLAHRFDRAERLYCFDSTAFASREDVLLLFLENEASPQQDPGEERLAWVEMSRLGEGKGESSEYKGELDLSVDGAGTGIGKGVTRAALISPPRKITANSPMFAITACGLMSEGITPHGWVGPGWVALFRPARDVYKIECFRVEGN